MAPTLFYEGCMQPAFENVVFSPNQTYYDHGEVLAVNCSEGFIQAGLTTTSECVDGYFEPSFDVLCELGKCERVLLYKIENFDSSRDC